MSTKHYSVKVNITFRNIEATDPIREYVQEKIGNTIHKFIHQDTEAHVVLKVEKVRQIAEATFHCDGADFNASAESDSLYAAIDQLAATTAQQLRKHKDKLVSHK